MEQIKLKHPYLREYKDSSNEIIEILKRCNNISNFYDELKNIKDNNIKGVYFEIFIEFLIKSLSNSSTLGISDYIPNQGKDEGVDGEGIFKGKRCLIQIKFSSKEYKNKADNIDNFLNKVFKFQLNGFFFHINHDSTAIYIENESKDYAGGIIKSFNKDYINNLININFIKDFQNSLLNYEIPIFKEKALYEHQEEALSECMKVNKGIILLPTGTGKTTIGINIFKENIKENNNRFLGVVFTPKICLNEQMLNEYHSELSPLFKDLHFIQFDSSKNNKTLYNFKYNKDLNSLYDKQIIICTYHSGKKLLNKIKELKYNIDVIIYDEAHYLVNKEWNDLINKEKELEEEEPEEKELDYKEINELIEKDLQSPKQYFFTATLKSQQSNNGIAMNNSSIYGDIIYKRTPAAMIGAKRMSKVHLINLNNLNDDFNYNNKNVSINKIEECINKFKEVSKKDNYKLLFILPKKEDFILIKEEINNNPLFYENKHIFIFHSVKEVGYIYNNEIKSREFLLQKIKELGKIKNSNIIIFHHNILTEGIDIPSLEGIIPFMLLNVTRFFQNLGRATRYVENKEAYIIVPDLEKDDSNLYIEYFNYLQDCNYEMNEIIEVPVLKGSKEGMIENLYYNIEPSNQNKEELFNYTILLYDLRFEENLNKFIYSKDDRSTNFLYKHISNILYYKYDERKIAILKYNLLNKMISNCELDKKYLVILNIEICLFLLKKGIKKENIYLYTNNENMKVYKNILYIDLYNNLELNKIINNKLEINNIYNNMKFDFILSNPPYNCEGLKAKQNMVFYKSFLEQGRKLANECYFVGPYSYLSSYKNLGITEIHKLGKETFDIAIQTAWVKIDSNQTENTFIDENILYSPIPKLKIEEKEVDMSLAGINLSDTGYRGIEDYKEKLSKTKQNEDDIEIYTSTQTIKYINDKDLLERIKNHENGGINNYNKPKIIWAVNDNLTNFIYIENQHYLPNCFKKLIIKDKEEGEKLIKYLKQENLNLIINSLDINSKIISKSTLSHIPLPLFLIPPDHQDQHFSNYFKVTENTTLDYNNPDTYIIDLEKLKK